MNFYAVFIVRILQGIGTSILYTVVAYIPSVWAPKNEMGTMLAVLSCGFQLSNIICMPVSGILCESDYGWRPIYYIFGVLTLLVHILFHIFYTDSPKEHRHVSSNELNMITADKKINKGQDPVPYLAMCSDVCVLSTWLAMCGRNVAFYVLVLYGPTYLREVLHFDVKGTGWAAAIPYVSCAIVKFASGQLTDRLQMFSEKVGRLHYFSSIRFSAKVYNMHVDLNDWLGCWVCGYVSGKKDVNSRNVIRNRNSYRLLVEQSLKYHIH